MKINKNTGVDWCFNADTLDFFEESDLVKIKPTKLKIYFSFLSDTKFNILVDEFKKTLIDTLPEHETKINLKKRFVIVKLKQYT